MPDVFVYTVANRLVEVLMVMLPPSENSDKNHVIMAAKTRASQCLPVSEANRGVRQKSDDSA